MISATVPAGERLFFTIDAQSLAGVDWHPVTTKAKDTKIILIESLESGIVALPFEFCFLVGRCLFGDLQCLPVADAEVIGAVDER